MRDILLATVFFGALPFVFRHPVNGAYLWAWVSLMSPHKLTFGFARGLPFALIVAVVTLAMLIFSRERRPFPFTPITKAQLVLLAWMSLTSLFALNESSVVLDRWLFVLKIQVMMFATLMLVRGRRQMEVLLWIVTMSIGIYGIKGGIWTVLTGGGGRVWGPPGGMIEGNNELAVALVMLIPFMYYLSQVAARRAVRYGLILCIVFTSFSVLGSQSRGALLALLAMAFFMGIKGRRPVRTSLLLLTLLISAIAFMPDSWTGRMESLQSYDADGSAMSRLRTWETMLRAAVDRPLVGVGFAADNRVVFDRYSPVSPDDPNSPPTVFVAHSIYFQMLGEHGFVGLAIFLVLGVRAWRDASRLRRETRDDPELGAWVPLLMQMVKVSMIGYGVGGAFLSLAYFDLPYYVVGFVVLADATVRERIRSRLALQDTGNAVPTVAPYLTESKT